MKTLSAIIFLIIILIPAFIPPIVNAGSLKSPQEFEKVKFVDKEEKDASFISFPFLVFVRGYQKIIGPIKGDYCPMYPSCSLYGYQAINKYNLRGVIMSIDRLHRCGHDLQYYDKVIIGKEVKNLDLVR